MEITKELILKLNEAKDTDELISLAKVNGIELAEKSAEKLFAKLNENGELNDEVLADIAGGTAIGLIPLAEHA